MRLYKIIQAKFFFIFILYLMLASKCAAEGRCVILLHGLGRTHYSMSKLSTYLKLHHYIVINQSYSTTRKSIEELAEQSIAPMINACLKYQPDDINFVTHSLGGIVLQQYLQHHKVPKLSRIVMLAPPNHGSPIADLLHNNFLFKIIIGPSGQELQTNNHSVPNQLPQHFPHQVGIIAGNFSFNPFGKLFFTHEANDGEVAVSSTRMNDMQDFIVLPVSHTFIMSNTRVMEQILYFLDNGKFTRK